jgi:predicted CXXCH cytochrome family protein
VLRNLKTLAAIVFVVLTIGIAGAEQHPVPLDPKQDPATCVQCHEAKTKGIAVHSAIPMGCTSCHEIRVNRDITRVKLITTTPVALCITCHADKKASDLKGQVHSPAVRDCMDCHDAHATANKNQLLKPTSGEKNTNLCLSCHDTGVNVAKGGSRHAALDVGCDACHVTHKTGERGKREFDFHLTKNAPALCIDCHDPKDAAIVKAHQGQPFEKSDCLGCHDPHQSEQPKLMAKFVHAPLAGNKCDSCHAAAKDGQVVLTQASGKELCLTCHSDKAEQIAKATVQHPGAAGDCTDCHSPHASNSPGLPKTDSVNICLGCHADQAEQHKKANLHQPAFEQGCATCHEPHGNDNLHLMRAKTPNALCLECHGPDAHPVKLEKEHLVTIFDGKVKLPGNYFSKVLILPLKFNMGHPVEGHPVSDLMDPTNTSKVRNAMNCMSCHQPHASTQSDLLVKDQANNLVFCNNCHKNRINMSDVTMDPPTNAK